MKKESIQLLFTSELKEVYNAEKQILNALPNVISAAESPDLKEALKKHFEETKGHVKRLEKIFGLLNTNPQEKTCEAMEGLIHECSEIIQEHSQSALRDAAIISKAQCIEHYEISVYGTLRTFAKEMGLSEAVSLLQDTLDEEANADKKLTKIAEGGLLTTGVNRKANR